MVKTEFVGVDYDSFDFEGRNYLRIFGRTDKGKRICVIDSFEGSFYAILREGVSEKKINEIIGKIEKLKAGKAGRESCVEKVLVVEKNYLGRKVNALRVFVTNFKDSHEIADQMPWDEIEKRREYDVPLVTKYIMEKKIFPLQNYLIEGSILGRDDFGGISEEVDFECIKLEKFSKINDKLFEPRILAYDIEADEFEIGKGNVLMISLYGKNFKKVLTWK